MICSNCNENIKGNKYHYRAGKNGSVFCSKDCCYEAYEGFYTRKEVDQTIKEIKGLNKEENKLTDKAQEPLTVLEVAKTLESAITTDPPFIFTITNSMGEYEQIVDREDFLEHYLNWATETLYNLVDIEE